MEFLRELRPAWMADALGERTRLVDEPEHCDHESVLPVLEPMLASTDAIAAPAADWAFEPKPDGWRVLVYFDGDLIVRTRNQGVGESTAEAKALCGRCLCARECREYALADPDLLGVWGGTSPRDRARLRKAAELSEVA